MTHATKEQLIAAKERIRQVFADGDLPFVIHLSGGNEDQLIRIFERIKPGDYVFGSHRSHYLFMLAGGTAEELESEVRAGRSMHLFRSARQGEAHLLTSSILAGICGVAAGVAWSIKANPSSTAKCWCFLGDGSEDEGAFFESANFVEGWDLPCFYIIEDNGKSVDTETTRRRGPHLPIRERWQDYKHVVRYHYRLSENHCGPNLSQNVTFNPEIVAKHAKGN